MKYDNTIMLFIEILAHLDKSWQKTEFNKSSFWIKRFKLNRVLLLKNSSRVKSNFKNEDATQFDDQSNNIRNKNQEYISRYRKR